MHSQRAWNRILSSNSSGSPPNSHAPLEPRSTLWLQDAPPPQPAATEASTRAALMIWSHCLCVWGGGVSAPVHSKGHHKIFHEVLKVQFVAGLPLRRLFCPQGRPLVQYGARAVSSQ